MLVILSLTRNRWSVPHTSNVCCGYGLPTFAYPWRAAQLRRKGPFVGRAEPGEYRSITEPSLTLR